MKRGSGVPHINSKMLANNVAIPVPPLEEQQHVVSILDRLDKFTNDLSSGLPAEIEARASSTNITGTVCCHSTNLPCDVPS